MATVSIDIVADADGAIREIRQVGDEMEKIEPAAVKASKSANLLRTALAAIGGIAVARGLASLGTSILRVGGEFENLQKRLEVITGSSESAAEAFAFIERTAQAVPFSVQQVTSSFLSLKNAGIDPTTGALETLIDGVALVGGSEADLQGIITAFTQIANKGKLSREELNQLTERGIAALPILKNQLQLTGGQLDELLSSGLDARTGLEALFKGIEERAGGASAAAMETLTGRVSNLKVAITDAARELAEGGFLDAAKDLLEGLTEEVTSLVESGALQSTAETLAKIGGFAVLAFGNIARLIPEVASEVAALGRSAAPVIDKFNQFADTAIAAGIAFDTWTRSVDDLIIGFGGLTLDDEITDLVKDVNELARSVRDFESVADFGTADVTVALGKFSVLLKETNTGVITAAESLSRLGISSDELFRAIASGATQIKIADGQFVKISTTFRDLFFESIKASRGVTEVAKAQTASKSTVRDYLAALELIAGATEETATQTASMRNEIEALELQRTNDKFNETVAVLTSLGDEFLRNTGIIAGLEEGIDAVGTVGGTLGNVFTNAARGLGLFGDTSEEVAGQLDQAVDGLEDAQNEFSEFLTGVLADFGTDVAGSFAEAFGGLIDGDFADLGEAAEALFDGIKDAARDAASSIANELGERGIQSILDGDLAQGRAGIAAGLGLGIVAQAESRGEGALGGAISGAGIGFQIGSRAGGVTAVAGAVIGAVIGAIGGFLAGQGGEEVGTVTGGVSNLRTALEISGTPEEREVIIRRQIDSAVRATEDGLRDILEVFGDPDIFSGIEGFVVGISGQFEDVQSFIRDLIENQVPDAIIAAFGPAFEAGIRNVAGDDLGDAFVDSFAAVLRRVDDLPVGERLAVIQSFVTNLVGLFDLVDALDFETLQADAVRGAFEASFDAIDSILNQIDVFGAGFETLDIEQQLRQVDKIRSAVTQAREIELRLLQQIQQVSTNIDRSIDAQIEGLQRAQFTTAEEADFLGNRISDIFQQIARASSPEEIARLVSQAQADIGDLSAIFDQFPELAGLGGVVAGDLGRLLGTEDIIAVLEELRAASQSRLAEFSDQIEARNEELLAAVEGTIAGLLALGEAAEDIGGVGGIDPLDEGFGRLTQQTEALSDAFRGLADQIQGPGAGVSPGLVLPPNVTVQISGSVAPMIQSVSAVVDSQLEFARVGPIS